MNGRKRMLLSIGALAAVIALALAARAWLPPVSCESPARLVLRCDELAGIYALLENDLETLIGLQERYLDEHYIYAPTLEMAGFVPSPGVTFVASSHAGRSWSVTLAHEALEEGGGCAVYLGENVPKPLLMGDRDVEAGDIFCAR